jgi:hypothetical protein
MATLENAGPSYESNLPSLAGATEQYREHGLSVIGVPTPEFPFETDVDSIRAAIDERRLSDPVAVDRDDAIWNAVANTSKRTCSPSARPDRGTSAASLPTPIAGFFPRA